MFDRILNMPLGNCNFDIVTVTVNLPIYRFIQHPDKILQWTFFAKIVYG